MVSGSMSPNQREILSARSTITGKQEYLTSTNGALNANVQGGSGGEVTIIDGAGTGNQAAVMSGSNNALAIALTNSSGDRVNPATEDTLSNINSTLATIDGKTPSIGQSTMSGSAPVAIASDQSNIPVANNYLSVPFSTTTPAMVATTDAGNYRWVSVQINTQGTSSVITFQSSNDNTNWNSMALQSSAAIGGTGSTQTAPTAASITYHGPLAGRYFRLNVSGISAGTTAGTVTFSTLPSAMQSINTFSAQNGTWTVGSNSATGSAVPANAFYLGARNSAGNLAGVQLASDAINTTGNQFIGSSLIAQLDDSSPTVITENNFGNVRMNAVRALYHENGPYLLGRATGDTQIKSSAGFIHSISIAPLTAAPTAGLLTVYDNTVEGGTVVYSEWVFATTPGHTVVLDVPMGTGIYVGFDGTLANVQATVSYR